jgi:hypothetical protein
MILRVDILVFLEGLEGDKFLLLEPLSEGEEEFVWFLDAFGAPEKEGGADVAGG